MSVDVRPHRPGVRSLAILIGCEAKMVARDTAGLVVPLGLPLLILLTSAIPASREVIFEGMTALELYALPVVLAMVIAMIGLVNMPSFLAYYRRTGILRRLSVTPASPAIVLIAQVIVSVLQALAGIALALAVAVIAFDAQLPRNLPAAIGVLFLAIAAMYALGALVAAVAPTPNSAVAIGLVAFLGLGALGGMFGGRQALPPALADVGAWLPFGAAADAFAATWAGTPVDGGTLAALGLSVVIGAGGAALFFRWE